MEEFGLIGKIRLVLITNGSLLHHSRVQDGIKKMASLGGEVWFKLDRATEAGIRSVNSTRTTVAKVMRNLRTAADLCPTWVQTCAFALDGNVPSDRELEAYLDSLAQLTREGVPLKGVLLYGVARPSHQPESIRISPVPDGWLESLADRIRTIGLSVTVTP
jgi:wyosine [tRNA(Phe)-imidazoG37] synthetase (radical SAM superfamily)